MNASTDNPVTTDNPAAAAALRVVLLGGLAMLFATLAMAIYLSDGNVSVFLAMQGLSKDLPGWWWQGATAFGDERMLLAVALPFCVRYPRLLWVIVVSGLIAGLASRGLKLGFDLPRPAAVLPPEALTIIGKRVTAHSFPSGHTVSAFAFVAAWLLCWPAARAWPWLVAAALVGVSRMAVGAHWPLDVLVGAALGLMGAVLAQGLLLRWPLERRTLVTRGVFVLGLLAVATLPFDGQGYPDTLPLRVAVCVLCFAGLAWQRFGRRTAVVAGEPV